MDAGINLTTKGVYYVISEIRKKFLKFVKSKKFQSDKPTYDYLLLE